MIIAPSNPDGPVTIHISVPQLPASADQTTNETIIHIYGLTVSLGGTTSESVPGPVITPTVFVGPPGSDYANTPTDDLELIHRPKELWKIRFANIIALEEIWRRLDGITLTTTSNASGADATSNPNASTFSPTAPPPSTGATTQKRLQNRWMMRAGTFQFGTDGGASFFNSNRPAFFDITGAVLWGGRNQIGLMAGYGQTSSALAGSIGGHAAGQTFIDQTLSSKTGMFGAEFARETWGVAKLELIVGADVVGQTTNNTAGFCGLGNATSPAGCHIFSTKTIHNTGIGSFVGGDFSYKLTHGLSLTTGIRYDTQPSIKSPASSGSNIGVNRVTVFGGLQFNYNWSRHQDTVSNPFAH
jgi:hypothetical protein